MRSASLATVQLVAFLEDTYGFEFAAHEVSAANLDTIELIGAFVEAGKPVFGVCRGLQLLNVMFGGTLWQDIPKDSRYWVNTNQQDW